MRLTIDLDNPSKRSAYNKFRLLARVYPRNRVEIRLSSGKRGYHIIVSGLRYGFNETLKFRRMLGDDLRRIRIDKSRAKMGLGTGVLFTRKGFRFSKCLAKLDSCSRSEHKLLGRLNHDR